MAVQAGGTPVSVTGTIIGGPCETALTSLGWNLGTDASCGLTGTGDLSADPLLAPLGDNGGPTPTRMLLPGSPAIDAIPTGTPRLCDGTLATDQRGVVRPQGTGCDIGAVEADTTSSFMPVP